MSATRERDHAARIAPTDPASALRVARDIHDPWFRCQALAIVAWHTPDHDSFLRLITESLDDAFSIGEPNRVVTVAAWPVAALARRHADGVRATGRNDRQLRSTLPRLLRIIGDEPSPASRADALLMLIHALSPSRPELRASVLGLLVKECRDPSNRKRRRQLESAALIVAADHPDAACELVGLLEDGPRQRAMDRIRDHPEVLGPRPFFELGGT